MQNDDSKMIKNNNNLENKTEKMQNQLTKS